MAPHALSISRASAIPFRTPWRSICPAISRWELLRRYSSNGFPPSQYLREQKKKRVSAMYFIPSPSTTDPSSMIFKLPQLNLEDRSLLRKALIVATPGVASWFEEGNPFLESAMNWMYSPIVAESPPSTHVAIVDSLPDPRYFESWFKDRPQPFPRAEGFAICLMSDIVSRQLAYDEEGGPAVLRVMSQKSDLSRDYKRIPKGIFSSLTIPLANTLFVNGSRNTAFRLQWRATEDGTTLKPYGDRVPLGLIQFNIFRDPLHVFNHYVPLHILTKPRQVVSSMGNVIRQLQGDGDKLLGASTELESEVPRFLARQPKDEEDATIQVFARVMPPDAEHLFPTVGKLLSETSTSLLDQDNQAQHTMTYHTLWRGGRIYRVTSGGGGWGKKAGLLSLDPATNFEPLANTEQSMFPDPEAEDDGITGSPDLGALVPAGYSIQFFAAKVVAPHKPYYADLADDPSQSSFTSLFSPEKWSRLKSGMVQQMVLGNTISNDFPTSTTPTEEERLAVTQTLPGCFGALSEGGTSVAVLNRINRDPSVKLPKGKDFEWRTLSEIRIDAPLAIFKATIPMSETKDNSSGSDSKSATVASKKANGGVVDSPEFPPLRTKKPSKSSKPFSISKHVVGADKTPIVRKIRTA